MKMVKIALNTDYGGFGLNAKGTKLFEELAGEAFDRSRHSRTNRHLIQVIEEGGGKANVTIEELPEGTEYLIDEYDGSEWIVRRDEMRWKKARVTDR